jgi:hypothetical protein
MGWQVVLSLLQVRVRSSKLRVVPNSVLLLYFPAPLLLSQQGKYLFELIVLFPIPADLCLEHANAIDGTIILERQLIVQNSVRSQLFLLSNQLFPQPINLFKQRLRLRFGLFL